MMHLHPPERDPEDEDEPTEEELREAELHGDHVDIIPEMDAPAELAGPVEVWPTLDVRDLEARGAPIAERGLSVDPDDLGRQWLNMATEQANFESSLVEEESDDELHVVEARDELGLSADVDVLPDEEPPEAEPARADEPEAREAAPEGEAPRLRARVIRSRHRAR